MSHAVSCDEGEVKMNWLNRIFIGFFILILYTSTVFSQQKNDPFMGDWKGVRKFSGKTLPVAAQVICWGEGKYQANIIEKFDQPVDTPKIVKLVGKLKGNKVVFDQQLKSGNMDKKEPDLEPTKWTAELTKTKFTGRNSKGKEMTFEMKKTVRLSSKLNARPPRGAVVLFNGKNLDEWKMYIKKKKPRKKKKKSSSKKEPAKVNMDKWSLIEGNTMEIKTGTGWLLTKREFGIPYAF